MSRVANLELCLGVTTYVLLWPENGRIKREDIRRVYDGSIFYEIEAKRKKNKL